MNGQDGKPFKTRAGGVLKLRDLIDQATEKARERLHDAKLGDDLPADEFEAIAHKVAIAALKFADLSNARTTSYVFDLDRFMSFEGKTGPLPAVPGCPHQIAAAQGRRPGRDRRAGSSSRNRLSGTWR